MRWGAAAVQALVGGVVGCFEALVLQLYQGIVDQAEYRSLAHGAFSSLTNGVLREPMLRFFANASDFSRRLVSVEANGKFSGVDAGPEDDPGKPADLASVVAHLKNTLGVKYMLCWHGLPGYWAGIMPGAVDTVRYKPFVIKPSPHDSLLEMEPSMAWNPAVLAGLGMV